MEPGPGPRSAGASKGFAPLKESVSRPPAPSVQSAVKDLEPHLLVKRFRLRETDAIAHPGGHYTIRVVGPLEIPALLGLGDMSTSCISTHVGVRIRFISRKRERALRPQGEVPGVSTHGLGQTAPKNQVAVVGADASISSDSFFYLFT